jgi:hypothetical protein
VSAWTARSALKTAESMGNSVKTRRAEEIVASFPGPVMLPTARRKWFELEFCMFAALFSLFAGLNAKSNHIVGILGAVFFGSIALRWITARVFPGTASLLLDADGLVIKRSFGSRRFHWREIDNFHIWIFTGLGFRKPFVVIETKTAPLRFGDKISATIGLGNYALLAEQYGIPADDLLKIMKAWRDLAVVPK